MRHFVTIIYIYIFFAFFCKSFCSCISTPSSNLPFSIFSASLLYSFFWHFFLVTFFFPFPFSLQRIHNGAHNGTPAHWTRNRKKKNSARYDLYIRIENQRTNFTFSLFIFFFFLVSFVLFVLTKVHEKKSIINVLRKKKERKTKSRWTTFSIQGFFLLALLARASAPCTLRRLRSIYTSFFLFRFFFCFFFTRQRVNNNYLNERLIFPLSSLTSAHVSLRCVLHCCSTTTGDILSLLLSLISILLLLLLTAPSWIHA